MPALIAVELCSTARGYLIAGHQSVEVGHRIILERLGLVPLLQLGMRLGEGTGAVLALTLLDSAVALYSQMATFEEVGVSKE